MAKPKPSNDPTSDTPGRILQAAMELFLRNGYGNTNLENVASAAGVTKPTIYSHFGSKKRLLLAISQAHAGAKAAAMSSALEPTGDVRADLTRFGEVFMQRVLNTQANRWQRLAMTESEAHPEVGQSIYEAGPARVISAMRQFVRGEVEAGRLNCEDIEAAAEQFFGLLLGVHPIRMMTGQKPPSKSKQKKICHQAVDTFLAAFGVEE